MPANVLDNNLATRWSNLGKGSWLQADLGAVKSVCSLGVAWYRGDARRSTFKVQVSTDGKTWKEAARTDYNFFEIPSGVGANSASIRVTSASGDVIVVKDVPMQADKSVKASVNYK